jgi:hypothetical protein
MIAARTSGVKMRAFGPAALRRSADVKYRGRVMKVLHVLPFFLAGTLVLISADGAAAPAIQAPPAAKAPDPYPPVRNATVVCAFSLPDDAKADVIKKALAALSTKEADCGIRYGR